jgi:glucose/arabinose dehydrogenase
MSSACLTSPLAEAALASGFCAHTLKFDVSDPRMLLAVGTEDIIFLEEGTETVSMWKNGTKQELVTTSGLNHGLAVHDNFIYASNKNSLYRWKYQGYFDQIEQELELVVQNINLDSEGSAAGGHWTRTPVFDSEGRLYLSVGSDKNVDDNSFRSRIRRFDDLSQLPLEFIEGQVFADGVRNEVGLAFDSFGVLWGVENGADNLDREDLGTGIFEDNPAEELNRFPEETAGSHYGYPYCWTEYKLPEETGLGRGTRWAWPEDFSNENPTDEQCRTDYTPSELAMQAHSAPLGLTFYEWKATRPEGCEGGFPEEYDGFAFIAFHGSWNRVVPTGYKVVYVPMKNGRAAFPGEDPVDLLAHSGSNAKWDDGFRPVDVDFDECGRLLVSSDGGGKGSKIVRIEYTGEDSSQCSTNKCSKTKPCCDTLVCKKKNGKRKCKPCKAMGKKCSKNKDCCDGSCSNGRCA